jgi:hypothetical protein
MSETEEEIVAYGQIRWRILVSVTVENNLRVLSPNSLH